MQVSRGGLRRFTTGKAATAILLMCVCSLAAIAGCSGASSAGPKATGIVTLNGTPVPNALVSFFPKGGGSSAFGRTGSDGRFSVKSSASSTGLPAGEYLVAVEPSESDAEEAESSRPTIPPKYLSEKTSGLKFTVTDSGPNDFTIELSSAE